VARHGALYRRVAAAPGAATEIAPEE
jgi:hypothetical protein